MRHLDLFSGIGGFALGLERAGFETVAFCEIEEFPRQVLRKHWPDVPIFEDVKELTGEQIEREVGPVDLITAGYPCQPFSLAGKHRGKEDDRHLWPEVNRLLAELRPAWFIGENVAGHINMGLDEVLSDLESQGYTARAFVIPAVALDAPHRRSRVWIMAHAKGFGCGEGRKQRDIHETHGRQIGERSPIPAGTGKQPENMAGSEVNANRNNSGQPASEGAGQDGWDEQGNDIGGIREDVPKPDNAKRRRGEVGGSSRDGQPSLHGEEGTVADTARELLDGTGESWDRGRQYPDGCRWLPEPNVGRVAHGIPKRVDRLKGLGNAVVPQIPEILGMAILAVENEGQHDRF